MELHQLDKLDRAVDRLHQVVRKINPDDPDPSLVAIALAEAKRVRRDCNLAVRQIAALRDQLNQP